MKASNCYSHAAARWGWGLMHGVLPESQAIRHSCESGPCMNPRHWYSSSLSPSTGITRVDQFTALDRDRFLGLHRANVFPMRVLASTFGISESKAWSMVGLSATKVVQKTEDALHSAVRAATNRDEWDRAAVERNKRLAIEREQKAIAAAKRKKVREANRAIFEAEEEDLQVIKEIAARQPLLFCEQCKKEVPLASSADAAHTISRSARELLESIAIEANVHQSCGWCGTHIRDLRYEFTSLPIAAARTCIREQNHRAIVAISAQPIFMAIRDYVWNHGVKVNFGLECRVRVFTDRRLR